MECNVDAAACRIRLAASGDIDEAAVDHDKIRAAAMMNAGHSLFFFPANCHVNLPSIVHDRVAAAKEG